MGVVVGVAALTGVRRLNGTFEMVYAGSPAPTDVDPDELARLIGEGYLSELPDEEVGGLQQDDPSVVTYELDPSSARSARAAAKKAADAPSQ